MLLLELTNPFDTITNYGAWLDTNKSKIYPVKGKYEHAIVAQQILGTGPISTPEQEDAVWAKLFSLGFVRIAWLKGHLFVQGTQQALSKGATKIAAAIGSGEFKEAIFTIVNVSGNDYNSIKDVKFSLPEERREAGMFVRNEI